jgi:hypothetical protein
VIGKLFVSLPFGNRPSRGDINCSDRGTFLSPFPLPFPPACLSFYFRVYLAISVSSSHTFFPFFPSFLFPFFPSFLFPFLSFFYFSFSILFNFSSSSSLGHSHLSLVLTATEETAEYTEDTGNGKGSGHGTIQGSN